jgi:hypothetical protein
MYEKKKFSNHKAININLVECKMSVQSTVQLTSSTKLLTILNY